MIDKAIVSLLRAHAGVDQRVYAGAELVNVTRELPKVVYTELEVERDPATDDGPTGLARGRYQLDIFAASPTAARTIADAIRIGMDEFSGVEQGVPILLIRVDSGRHGPPVQVAAAAVTIARYIQNLTVVYREQTS